MKTRGSPPAGEAPSSTSSNSPLITSSGTFTRRAAGADAASTMHAAPPSAEPSELRGAGRGSGDGGGRLSDSGGRLGDIGGRLGGASGDGGDGCGRGIDVSISLPAGGLGRVGEAEKGSLLAGETSEDDASGGPLKEVGNPANGLLYSVAACVANRRTSLQFREFSSTEGGEYPAKGPLSSCCHLWYMNGAPTAMRSGLPAQWREQRRRAGLEGRWWVGLGLRGGEPGKEMQRLLLWAFETLEGVEGQMR